MAWRLAKSLDTLRKQINDLSPNRSKVSDGTIGDAAHASRSSDHNPWVKLGSMGIVTALDITNDPVHGVRSRAFAEALLASRDSRIKYVISDGEIASGTGQGKTPWVWRKYTGKNSHHHHFHLSVKSDAASFDSTRAWDLSAVKVAAREAAKPVAKDEVPTLARGAKGAAVGDLQRALVAAGYKVSIDDDFGPKTEAAVKTAQRKAGIVVDGKVGPATRAALAMLAQKAA